MVRTALVDCDQPSPSGSTSDLGDPCLNSRDAVAREGPRGRAGLNARCFTRDAGPLVGGTARLRTRTARTLMAVAASTEGGGIDAVGAGVAGGIGVATAGTAIGPAAKHKRFGPKVAQVVSSSSPSLADLAWLAATSGGLV